MENDHVFAFMRISQSAMTAYKTNPEGLCALQGVMASSFNMEGS